MKIGLLTLGRSFKDANDPIQAHGITRIKEEAEAKGHQVTLLFEPLVSYRFNSKIEAFYEGKPFPDLDIILARQAVTAEPSLHTVTVETLKKVGYKVVNGMPSFSVSKNKLASLLRLHENNIPIPNSIVVRHPSQAQAAAELIGFPVVVKIAFGTHGRGVFIAKDNATLRPIVDYLNVVDRNPVIIQEFIEEADQKDIRVFVIGDKVAGTMERVSQNDDFRSNAHLGGIGRPVKLSQTEIDVAIKASRDMNLEISGVDILRSKRGPLVIEVNSNPGFEELEKATEINVASKIVEYLESLA